MKLFKIILFFILAQSVFAQSGFVTTWPVSSSNKLVAAFGEFRPNYSSQYGPHFHGGIDIGGDATQLILAAGAISKITYTVTTG
jgi:hypothetical protein